MPSFKKSLLTLSLTSVLAACGAPDEVQDDVLVEDSAALQNSTGAYVATMQTFRSGRIVGGSLASTRELDGVAERMLEGVPTYGSDGMFDDWKKLESEYTIPSVPAGNYKLRMKAKKTLSTTIEQFRINLKDPAQTYPYYAVCNFTTTSWVTCEYSVRLTAGNVIVAISDYQSRDATHDGFDVDFIGLIRQ